MDEEKTFSVRSSLLGKIVKCLIQGPLQAITRELV